MDWSLYRPYGKYLLNLAEPLHWYRTNKQSCSCVMWPCVQQISLGEPNYKLLYMSYMVCMHYGEPLLYFIMLDQSKAKECIISIKVVAQKKLFPSWHMTERLLTSSSKDLSNLNYCWTRAHFYPLCSFHRRISEQVVNDLGILSHIM